MTLMTVELSLTRSLIVPTGRMDLQKKLFASIQLVGFFTPCSIQTMNWESFKYFPVIWVLQVLHVSDWHVNLLGFLWCYFWTAYIWARLVVLHWQRDWLMQLKRGTTLHSMMCMSGRIFVCLPFMLRICFSPLDIPCATFWEVWIFHFLFAFDFFSVICDFDNLVTACCDSKTVSESVTEYFTQYQHMNLWIQLR